MFWKKKKTQTTVAVVGIGTVGSALVKLMDRANFEIIKVDKENADQKKFPPVDFLHICIPYDKKFVREVLKYIKRFKYKPTIIHSTVLPGTCETISERSKVSFSLCYSPVRGQHDNLVRDLLRYRKFFACTSDNSLFENHLRDIGFSTFSCKRIYDLEVAKVLDTTTYGLQIAAVNEIQRIARELRANENLVFHFQQQHNSLYPNLRSSLKPGFVGGTCVRQNIALLRKLVKSKYLDLFIETNRRVAKENHLVDEVKY